MKHLIYISFFLLICGSLHAQMKQAGSAVKGSYESPHPYAGSIDGSSQKVWSQTITLEGASFVMVHFAHIHLGVDDYLIVKNPEGDRSWAYTNEEIKRKGNEFWSVHIYGEILEIEIHSKNNKGDFGYKIDLLQKGFPLEGIFEQRAICGTDDTQEAVCYLTSEPAAYNRSITVARILTVKNGSSFWGTGWVLGSDDHFMTNEYIISNQTEANNTTYEFGAQATDCSSSCNSLGACSGIIFATSATFIKDNVALDYCLVKLPPLNIGGLIFYASATYGYLQMRSQGAFIGERLYIPQHPAGWGKRLAMVSDNVNDTGGFPQVQSKTVMSCQGGGADDEVGYWADVQGGSSGSPVLGYSDNLVIALHHCSTIGCVGMNHGIRIENIIADLGALLPPNAVACPSSLNITSNVNANAYDIQSAGSTINASNMITSTATVRYDAGSSLTLTPGFRALVGSDFIAFLDGCN